MVEDGIIARVAEATEWASPIVIVTKLALGNFVSVSTPIPSVEP